MTSLCWIYAENIHRPGCDSMAAEESGDGYADKWRDVFSYASPLQID